MGITDDIKGDIFTKGMRADTEALGDKPSTKGRGYQPDWDAIVLQEIQFITITCLEVLVIYLYIIYLKETLVKTVYAVLRPLLGGYKFASYFYC